MAHRKHALGLLQRSQNIFETLPFPTQDFDEENEIAAAHIEFLEENEKCFHSNHPVGHFTASSLIVDKTFSRVLLTHHKKLNMWLQLGGHADGNSQIHETAMREAKEESGLTNIHFVNIDALKDPEDNDLPLPFDLDYHRIPKRKEMEAHIHYDFDL